MIRSATIFPVSQLGKEIWQNQKFSIFRGSVFRILYEKIISEKPARHIRKKNRGGFNLFLISIGMSGVPVPSTLNDGF